MNEARAPVDRLPSIPVDAPSQMETMGDTALVDLAQRGCESAVRILVRRNNQRLFRVARGIVRDDAEAEDVVQETYVRAFTALGSFRAEARFSTWLTRIAINEAFGRIRRRRVMAELPALDTAVTADPGLVSLFPLSLVSPAADSETDRSEMRKILEQEVDALPADFRIVFILRDVEGLSIEETSAQLALKPETVKTRLHRARRLLRTRIEERLASNFADLFPFDGARCAHMADRVLARLQEGGAGRQR